MSLILDILGLDKENENQLNRALRPESFQEYIGQKDLIKILEIAIKAAKDRDEPIDHILLYGPPGLGKTSIAQVIAAQYKSNYKSISAPAVGSIADLIEIFTQINNNDIVFIDEIHALNSKIEENIYSAMEDFKISYKMGNRKIVEIPVNPFCLIGATTHPGRMSAPLRDRFGIIYNMQFYTNDELCEIIRNNADKMQIKIANKEAALNLAKRCRGVPRVANRLLRRVRDYSQINNNNVINEDCVNKCLEIEGVDPLGFTMADKKYMWTLYKVYTCGPCGIDPIAASCGEDKITVSEHIEPYLVRSGFIARTPRGRVLTGEGMKYILNLNKNKK